MTNKDNKSLEELKEELEQAKKVYEYIQQSYEKKEKEETEKRKAKLEAEKTDRRKKVDEAFKQYNKLLQAYLDDYGTYSCATDEGVCDLFSSKFWNSIW